ncbi:MAG: hypothetical protein KY428_11350 [Bacteroidetes bacterium]|nr:hypothetical protein [Bacteroidota bacterium]
MSDGIITGKAYKNSKTETERNKWYNIYLNTNHFKMKKHKCLVRAKFKCEVCNINGAGEARHLSMDRLGAELRSDLLAVCTSCNLKEQETPTVTHEDHKARLDEAKRQRSRTKWGVS